MLYVFAPVVVCTYINQLLLLLLLLLLYKLFVRFQISRHFHLAPTFLRLHPWRISLSGGLEDVQGIAVHPVLASASNSAAEKRGRTYVT